MTKPATPHQVELSHGLLELLADYVFWQEQRLGAEGRDKLTHEWAKLSEQNARAQVAAGLAGELEKLVRPLVDERKRGEAV